MAAQPRTVDRIIARMASRAQGVVTNAELRAAGVSRHEIARRRDSGVLIPEFRGVYRVGHRAPSIEATYMAAVKACGKRAVVSGLAAAFLWGLIRRPPSMPEVTVPTERHIDGIACRRARGRRIDRTTHKQIPITTVAWTVVDIAAHLDDEQLARACHQADVRWGLKPRSVEAVLTRYRNAPGAGRLTAILNGDTRLTLSALERGFLQLLRDRDLPLPKTNRKTDGHYVDCRWPEHKLTVELDSYRFHNTRYAFEQDRRRERQAYARGDQFRRYTWGDVFEHPAQMLAELGGLLRPERDGCRR